MEEMGFAFLICLDQDIQRINLSPNPANPINPTNPQIRFCTNSL